MSAGVRIYATRVLQLSHPTGHSEGYRRLLSQADSSVDYPALTQAIIGLRDAYLAEPVTAAVDRVSDPHREIRLAATLALVEHPDRTKAVALLRDAEARRALLRP